MNDTVARIVDLMFDNVEMNEETAALRDEVMNNCQDRYHDLVQAGVPEDEAVEAVVESLRGMEEVIALYGRRNARSARASAPQETTAEESDAPVGEQEVLFAGADAQAVRKIDLTLISEDVTVEASGDDAYHICWNADTDPQVRAELNGGVLRIDRSPDQTYRNRGRSEARSQQESFNMPDFDGDLNHIGSMMEHLGRAMGRLFGAARMTFHSGEGVTIRIPLHLTPEIRLVTTSGDLKIVGVGYAGMDVVTTSGDITLQQRLEKRAGRVKLRTTSGDMEVSVCADAVEISSTSGDVEVMGCIGALNVSTISGDIDVHAGVAEVFFKAISGDVDIDCAGEGLRSVSGSTISGDVELRLPAGTGRMDIRTQTRSGDVTTRCNTNGFGPAVTGSITSMSGDITIR